MPYRAAILSAIEKLKDDPLVGSPSSSIRHHIQQHDKTFATTALAANSSGSDDTTKWNESLYQTTLKSLITKKTLLKNSNGNYMYSDEYMQRRTRGLRSRAESIEDAAHHQHSHRPREEPPKEIPKKKTFHANVKINEGKVITVVNPESKKHGGDDEMDTDDGMSSESSGSNKKHLKIIPRRVCLKKM